ncbi:MAG: Uma2 family endonuclease [Gemmatimonadota bacterium]
MPDENVGYELVDGRLVPVTPASMPHGVLLLEFAGILSDFVKSRGLGRIAPDTWFRLGLPHDPERVRAPDIAFIAAEKLPLAREAGWGVLRFVPDLAIEIYAPANQRKAADFHQRIRDYLDAGVRALWVIYPDARYVTAYHPDGNARVLRENESLKGEDILPGFEIELGHLWKSLEI